MKIVNNKIFIGNLPSECNEGAVVMRQKEADLYLHVENTEIQ